MLLNGSISASFTEVHIIPNITYTLKPPRDTAPGAREEPRAAGADITAVPGAVVPATGSVLLVSKTGA